MKSFKLVNPLIVGNFNTDYTSESGIDAVSQFWNDFSSHITGNLPAIYVTLKDKDTEKLSHYKISEKINKESKTSEFTIAEFKVDLTAAKEKKFLKGIEKFNNKINSKIARQTGGEAEKKSERKRYKDNSSSSSSDDSDYYNFRRYRRLTQPVSYFYYTPLIYDVDCVFIPTFTAPLSPYIQLYYPIF